MKLKSILSAFAAVALFAVGCTEEPIAMELADLQVSDTYVALPTDGGSATLNVTANAEWAFDGVPDWLTVTPANGAAGETTVTFKADKATSTKEAVVKIVVSGTEQYIHVQQGVKEAAKPSTCAEIIAGPDNKTYQVTGTCVQIANTQYGNWYIQDETGKVYVYGTLNNGEAQKFTSLNPSIEVGDVITVEGPKTTYNGTVELVDVTVIKVVKSLLTIPVKEYSLGSDGGIVEVKLVYKGKDLQVKPQVDWITMSDINVNADTTIVTLKVDGNTTSKPVVGAVHFASAANGQASEADINITVAGLAGTVDTPFTVAEAIEFCSKLTSATTTNYYVKGKVAKIYSQFSENYGTAIFWLSDDGKFTGSEDGKTSTDLANNFEAYSVYWFDNKPWVNGNGLVSEGDEVVICGQLTNYKGTCETNSKKAYVYSVNGLKTDANGLGSVNSPLTIKGAIDYCTALGSGKVSDVDLYVKGKVSKIYSQFSASYGTAIFWLSDDGTFQGSDDGKSTTDKTKNFEAYSVYWYNNASWKEGNGVVAVGDEVVVKGKITNYNGLAETSSKKACIYSINGKTE